MSDLRKLLDIVVENSESKESFELHDSFDIEVNEDYVIETGIVGFTEDGVIIQGDSLILEMFEEKGLLIESIDNPEYDDEAGMADNNLETLRRAVDGIDELINPGDNLPEWCQEKIAVAKAMLVNVWDYMKSEVERGAVAEEKQGLWANIHAKRKRIKSGSGERMRKPGSKGAPSAQDFKDAAKTSKNESLDEAEYQGRKVTLNKPTKGDVKKKKVYVKKPNGNIVKVEFGDPNMKIKKSNPARRKSFRARHRCENPGPKWKARYWSCKAW
jgi:hypothetical protein